MLILSYHLCVKEEERWQYVYVINPVTTLSNSTSTQLRAGLLINSQLKPTQLNPIE